MGKRPGQSHWAVPFTSIGTKMPAEGSKRWCQLCVAIYHKLWAAATTQSLNCFWDKLRLQGSKTLPQRISTGRNPGSLWSVGFSNTALSEIKPRRADSSHRQGERGDLPEALDTERVTAHLWHNQLPTLESREEGETIFIPIQQALIYPSELNSANKWRTELLHQATHPSALQTHLY